jgi:hypothetical protein
MRGGGADVDANAGEVRVWPDRALVVMPVVAVALVIVRGDRHVEVVADLRIRFVDLNKQIGDRHRFF